jgi:TIR domain
MEPQERTSVGANTPASKNGVSPSGANLSYAHIVGTAFLDTDLSETKGLSEVEHRGPSSIGLETVFKSRGRIPDAFLRGAGVPEIFLHYASSLTDSPIQFYSCFISYSHADKLFAHRLHDALQGRGIRCWLDEKQLLPGDQIHRVVDEAVRLWDKVFLCCSQASLTSWWVDKEIQKALMKEEQLWKERGKEVLAIISLNLDGQMFEPQWQDWKQQHLKTRLAADFSGWEKDNGKFDEQFERVVQALRADANAREQPPKPGL